MRNTLVHRPAAFSLILVIGLLAGAVSSPRVPETAFSMAEGGIFIALHKGQEDSAPRSIDQADVSSTDTGDEPLFEEWPDPLVTLFISGRQNGYIEPCGCTGLDNQKGGMMRRHTLFKQLEERGWNPIGLDIGNQVQRYGRQANLKLWTTYESLGFEMDYQAIGFGPNDLGLPTLELMAAMTNSGLSTENFVAANVVLYDPGFTSRYRILAAAGRRVGVTMVLGDEYLDSLPPGDGVRTMPVDRALREITEPMRREKCDWNVLLAYTSLDKCRELARDHPWFDLVVCGGVDGEPTREPEEIPAADSNHATQLIQSGYKGMHVGVVGFFDDREHPVRYQRVPLDARFEDSDEIKVRFLSYQRQLEALGLEGLEVDEGVHASGREFVGSDSCEDCHDTAYDIWKNGIDGEGGPHFRATLDLTEPGERTWVQRHHDPECLSCHVTGWNPQQYYPYKSGYKSLDDVLLHANGCENCHGPGSRHVEAENGDIDVDEPTRRRYAEEMIVTLEQARNELCFRCHDIDNSPDFHIDGAFEEYWSKIEHEE